jgi:ferritin
MQWYVNEKLEEETTTPKHLDKLTMIGNDKTEHYFFDAT